MPIMPGFQPVVSPGLQFLGQGPCLCLTSDLVLLRTSLSINGHRRVARSLKLGGDVFAAPAGVCSLNKSCLLGKARVHDRSAEE